MLAPFGRGVQVFRRSGVQAGKVNVKDQLVFVDPERLNA
jgi:hypothetical protein